MRLTKNFTKFLRLSNKPLSGISSDYIWEFTESSIHSLVISQLKKNITSGIFFVSSPFFVQLSIFPIFSSPLSPSFLSLQFALNSLLFQTIYNLILTLKTILFIAQNMFQSIHSSVAKWSNLIVTQYVFLWNKTIIYEYI